MKERKMAYSIVEGSAHKKLEREVVRPFGRLAGVVHLRVIPVDLRIHTFRFRWIMIKGLSHEKVIPDR